MHESQPEIHADLPFILVVDDDEYIRAVLTALFEGEAFHVIEAADGIIALAYVRLSLHPLIIITDHQMPNLGGEGLARTITSDTILVARHRLIYSTAQYQTLSLELRKFLQKWAIPIIAKPFELEEIEAVVQRIAHEMQTPQT